MPLRESFQSISQRGLDRAAPAMRLWAKAKRLGVWNPEDIDYTKDARDWHGLTPPEQDLLLRLSTLFQAGEEAVTFDILPLIGALAAEGRLEEEIYLSSFLFEEAKHVDAFHHFLSQVVGDNTDFSRYLTPSYEALFCDELPRAMQRLRTDPSPEAQARASVTYNLVVEGVMAETGYHGYFEVLRKQEIMPGMLETVGYLKRDESRHLAFGVYLLSRLVAEHGAWMWDVIQARLAELLPLATGMIAEAFAPYDPIPFGLAVDDFLDFAMTQFQLRLGRIEQSRGQSLAELHQTGVLDLVISTP